MSRDCMYNISYICSSARSALRSVMIWNDFANNSRDQCKAVLLIIPQESVLTLCNGIVLVSEKNKSYEAKTFIVYKIPYRRARAWPSL